MLGQHRDEIIQEINLFGIAGGYRVMQNKTGLNHNKRGKAYVGLHLGLHHLGELKINRFCRGFWVSSWCEVVVSVY